MANSYVFYTGDGATTDYTVPFPYIEEAHVHVLLDSIETTDFSFQSPSVIRFASAPGDGVEIRIYRDTSSSERLVDYNVPGNLTEEDLDLDSIQAFYLAQEAVDTAALAGPEAAEAAEAAQTAAEEAQAAAEQALDDAIAARDKAAQWSDNPEDDEVETGRYSAKHWAAKAEEAIGTLAGLPNSGDAGRVPMVNGSGTGYVLAGPLHGFRNRIINGNFDFWQRGTSQSGGGYGSADRWLIVLSGATMGASRQNFAVGQAVVPGSPKHFIRVSATVGNDHARIEQRIEGVGTFAGQKATLSFWAKGTNPGGGRFYATFGQFFGTGGSPSPEIFGIGAKSFVVTSQWQRFSVTVDLPSIAGKTLGTDGNDFLQVAFSQGSDTSTAPWTLDLARVQLEAGETATPFDDRPLGVELALCQRYFEIAPRLRVRNTGASTLGLFVTWNFKVTKRAAPTYGNLPSDFAIQSTASPLEGMNFLINDVPAGAIGQVPAGGPPITADAEI